MSDNEMLGRVSRAEWKAVYADDMLEIFSDRVTMFSDGHHVRFAFGRKGAPNSSDLLSRDLAKYRVGVTIGLNALLPMIDELVEWKRQYEAGSDSAMPRSGPE
ncbi:MAG: hypothetical protein P0Y66_22345 [Candidatus Kaistia colombiensis]|nr:MAG: hypothetical protein P0Y66_22345 [Kaistia sp.]